MNFVAIDFETANSKSESACSMAAVTIRNGAVERVAHQLIKPPDMYFSPYNVDIHGIKAEDVINKPKFNDIWDRVKMHLEGNIIVAHNAAFDISVLRKLLTVYGLDKPCCWYICTVAIARKVWRNLPNHKLSTMAEALSISFRHHNALQDAYVCAEIPLRAAKKTGTVSMEDLLRHLRLECKKL